MALAGFENQADGYPAVGVNHKLYTMLDELGFSDYNLSNNKIWIVGYSRGGAVVDLATRQINQNLADYSVSADDLYAYTFGAPRASAEMVAMIVRGLAFRIRGRL